MTEEEKAKIHGPGKEFESLFHKATNYLETNIELYKLKAINKSADIVSSIIKKLLIALVFFIFFKYQVIITTHYILHFLDFNLDFLDHTI